MKNDYDPKKVQRELDARKKKHVRKSSGHVEDVAKEISKNDQYIHSSQKRDLPVRKRSQEGDVS